MNEACNALAFRDGVRVRDCQCPALDVGDKHGFMRGLEAALAVVQGADVWTEVVAGSLIRALIEQEKARG